MVMAIPLSARPRTPTGRRRGAAGSAVNDRGTMAVPRPAAPFTANAVLDGDQGTYHGREALRRGLAEVWGAEPAGTLHLTLNPVIDADPASAAAAVARSVLLIIAPGTPPALVATAQHAVPAPRRRRVAHHPPRRGTVVRSAASQNRERPVEKP